MKTSVFRSKRGTVWQINIDEKYIEKSVRDGIKDTIDRMASDAVGIASQSRPGVYHDRGTLLSKILNETGLSDHDESGRLLNTWETNLTLMRGKIDKTTAYFPILDYELFNRDTRWIGLTGTPRMNSQNIKLEHYSRDSSTRDIDVKVRGQYSVAESDDAVRPLPSVNGGFKFMRNPYPGFGYWKLYHDGIETGSISYAPRPTFMVAFQFMFGVTSGHMTGNYNRLKYSDSYRTYVRNMLAHKINMKLGVA